ncbi:MAG: FtsX-like permease family protein [Ruminococcus sp.]|nr:FtsX-like permease family protein [Ruminococcus sp.]
MKHLISLSLKYIRRQKLRTCLTFMCIMLSAFILTTMCTYGSSLYTTLYNYTVYEAGKWESDITSWLENAADKEKALDIISRHAVVSDHIYTRYDTVFYPISERYTNGDFFEVTCGNSKKMFSALSSYTIDGNKDLLGQFDELGDIFPGHFQNKDGIYVSDAMKTMGCSEGDTVTVSVRPVTGVLDESSDMVKKARAELKEEFGTEYCKGDPEYEELPKDVRKKAYGSSIKAYLKMRKGISEYDLPYTDIQYGEPVSYTFKIAGFTSSIKILYKSDIFMMLNTEESNIDLSSFIEKNPDVEFNSDTSAKIRLTDNIDYDEALKALFTDLGYDYDRDYFDSVKFPHRDNNLLLALEWKSADAIYKFLAGIVTPCLLILLIGWFISRFVIDNTFEMAVQERSTHFAALRIMGASKGQVAFLVLAEAVFYCLTAVPLGMLTAVLLCCSSFNSLRRGGVPMVEFSAKPAFMALAAFLVIIAIFISAYTSAMWASRKLSPAEALNFGKPKSRKKKLRRKKSRLSLSSRKFLRRYTRKNIATAKSRFIVSTITMALGVLMFTFTALMATYVAKEIKENTGGDDNYDFYIMDYISSDPGSPTAETDKYFADREVFSEYMVRGCYDATLNDLDGSDKTVAESLMRVKKDNFKNIHITVLAIDETGYKKAELDKITGMSYEEFRQKDGALYNNSIYGEFTDYDEKTNEPVAKYEKDYTELGKACTITNYIGDSFRIIGKVSCGLDDALVIIPIEKSTEDYMTYDVMLKVSDRQHYDEAERLINEFQDNAVCFDVENHYAEGTGLSTLVTAVVKIVISFLISIWLVGILSMINSVNTSALNRSRELMMLRSVGMTRKQLRKSIILETIMFSATAAVTGTILGVIAYLTVLSDEPQKSLIIIPGVVVLSLAVNIIISLAAAIPAVRTLGRVESIARASGE